MLLEIILALLLGTLAGTITGLIPGIHINLIGSILISASLGTLIKVNPIYLLVFIVAMSITHTFLDFIPSIYLGAPEAGTELSVLPGHQLLLKGRGHEAILITLKGSLYAIFSLIILSPFLIWMFPRINPFMKNLIPYILIAISIFLISKEKRKPYALLIFSLAGILGMLTLNSNLKEPLFPLLTGLFGASNLFISLKNKTKIPPQKVRKIKLKIRGFLSPAIFSLITSSIIGFLPGVSSSQSAVISSEIKKMNPKQFLFLLGATNTIIMIISFLTYYTINKTRTGSAAFLKEIIFNLTYKHLILILIIVLISGIISYYLGIFFSKKIARNLNKINYSKISLATLILLVLLVLVFSRLTGILIFLSSTLLGIYCIQSKVRRINLMGSLLIPTILLYLF